MDNKKAKQAGKSRRRGKPKKSGLPFGSRNYIWLGIGLITIVLGYISLAQGPVNSFWSLTLAPILLVIGYCVLIPIGLLLKEPPVKVIDFVKD